MPRDKSDQKLNGTKKKQPRSLTVDALGSGSLGKAAKKLKSREEKMREALGKYGR